MSSEDIIRAWKDPDNRGELLGTHPAGAIELGEVGGANAASITGSLACFTFSIATAVAGCLTFDTTWCHGTCGAGSIGCCEEAQ